MSKYQNQDGEHCLSCGKYVSTEVGYTDYDWSHGYPTFGVYCDDKCADAKRAKTDPAAIEQIERANGSWRECAA